MDIFFSDDDRTAYLSELSKQASVYGVAFLAWCLMTNHVHLVAVPQTDDSLAKGIGEAHKRYTRRVNFREGWRGYLFQGRFFSCPVEPVSLLAVVRYVLRNPVRAGVVRSAEDYPWSSAQWLCGLRSNDPLIQSKGALEEIDDWRTFLGTSETEREQIRKHTRTGRPLGGDAFTKELEDRLDRVLRKKKPGPSPRRQRTQDPSS